MRLHFHNGNCGSQKTHFVKLYCLGKNNTEQNNQKVLRCSYIILIYIQQDATLHSLFYLETALHVSRGTSTHHQERKQLYLQHLVLVTSLLLPAAIVEELEPVWVCCGWRTSPTAHSNQNTLQSAQRNCSSYRAVSTPRDHLYTVHDHALSRFDMTMKPTNTHKRLKVSYIRATVIF